MFVRQASWAVCSLALLTSAASFPPKPEGVTVVESTKFPGYSISYKETSICETTPGVKGYSGYVNLPPNSAENRNYPSHMYFWFFEAREDSENASLSIWLQGGPGVPSASAALNENGPCHVLEDSKTTVLSSTSWNQKVNLMYIDQPLQVGYSYDTLVNGTLDIVASPFAYRPANFNQTGVPETNLTFLTGTFASENLANAPNTSMAAAPFMWHFMQTWLQEFPAYKPKTNSFSMWGESYHGHYGPVFADYFEQQNDLISNGTLSSPYIPIAIDTVGFINACIDIDTQQIYYPKYARNNTYSIEAMSQEDYDAAIAADPMCRNMTANCRALAAAKDPNGVGNQADVNAACKGAFDYCFENMHDAYDKSGLNEYDITTPASPQAFPPKYAAGYLNNASIQQALGVPLNWTGQSIPIALGFDRTGDFVLGKTLEKLGSLLDRGVKIALVYGDRDYQCNWLGGEAISLAIKSKYSTAFAAAGYTPILTNSTYTGGLVRQYGPLSFSRVFQAAHALPYYQPETAQAIFNRVVFDKDVATGEVDASGGYASVGSESAWSESGPAPDYGKAKCYLWDVLETCTSAEEQVLYSRRAVVKDYILVGQTSGNGTNGTSI
ncbi:alpha/beta-hydrolase [Setomelanomma holmii]|uniref:Alpha/beta-hydrolase n=1 Tax=Setomelanomma holmii TaxID=210430 RepID=A0A9P4LL99_9PLEO|nr:alpha/beta-hydrolase [Setomelanomma holmii]